jgi:hypothetical protein
MPKTAAACRTSTSTVILIDDKGERLLHAYNDRRAGQSLRLKRRNFF